jgi:hypothetical protein
MVRRWEREAAVRNFVLTWGFDVKEGRAHELQQWLSGNEEKIAAEAPAGTEYMGTYTSVLGGERSSGYGKTFWGLDSYAAQDAWTAAMKEGGTFTRLIEEFTDFIDQDNHANGRVELARKVTDAAIWGE